MQIKSFVLHANPLVVAGWDKFETDFSTVAAERTFSSCLVTNVPQTFIAENIGLYKGLNSNLYLSSLDGLAFELRAKYSVYCPIVFVHNGEKCFHNFDQIRT